LPKQVLDIGFFSYMYSQVSGIAKAVRSLAAAIAKTGHRIHVFSPAIRNGNSKPKTLFHHSIGGYRVGHDPEIILSFPIHNYFFPDQEYLDLIHIMTPVTIGLMGLNWAKYLGKAMIGTHHSPLSFYSDSYIPILGKLMNKTGFLWAWERHIWQKFDLITVPTPSKKKLLLKHRFTKTPIISLTNGIEDFYFKKVNGDEIREKYKIGDKKLLVYASRQSPEKNIEKIVKSFKEIHKTVPDSHLLLVGSGPSMESIRNRINRYRLNDCVTQTGYVSDIELLKIYKTADVTTLYSWVEAEGLVLLEAMAQGTPSVGANGCGIQDVIRHGETGYLVNNLKEFEDHVIQLFQNDDLRAEFSKNCLRYAETHRINEVAKRWIEIYKFTINELHPLRFYKKPNEDRFTKVREFVNKLPGLIF
jgi:1,2-diacylglycerol 3-alpha-glucosyltransferase